MNRDLIKECYQEYYEKQDKEGKKYMTHKVRAILETMPPSDMAKAIVLLLDGREITK